MGSRISIRSRRTWLPQDHLQDVLAVQLARERGLGSGQLLLRIRQACLQFLQVLPRVRDREQDSFSEVDLRRQRVLVPLLPGDGRAQRSIGDDGKTDEEKKQCEWPESRSLQSVNR
jgi:hypothetical protein